MELPARKKRHIKHVESIELDVRAVQQVSQSLSHGQPKVHSSILFCSFAEKVLRVFESTRCFLYRHLRILCGPTALLDAEGGAVTFLIGLDLVTTALLDDTPATLAKGLDT